MDEILGPAHKVRPGGQRVLPELQICKCEKQRSLHRSIPAMTQQPQTSLHPGIFHIVYLHFSFSLCAAQPLCAQIFSSSTSPFGPQHHPHTASTCLGPFFAATSLNKLPSPEDDLKASPEALVAARLFHVKSLIAIYSCFSSFISPCIIPYLQVLPILYHLQVFSLVGSLMKMLINVRAHTMVTHQKPLCNSASLFCLWFWSLHQRSGHTAEFTLLQKSERWHKCGMWGFGNASSCPCWVPDKLCVSPRLPPARFSVCPSVKWGQSNRQGGTHRLMYDTLQERKAILAALLLASQIKYPSLCLG